MKVVLFCDGKGMQMNGRPDQFPKSMLKVGFRPLIWNIMKYYAHFGHKEFILCLGHHAELIKNFFMNYKEIISRNFIIPETGKQSEFLNAEINDWRITFKYTGINAGIGKRLLAVKKFLKNEEMFLSNFVDGLTDLHLPDMINWFKEHKNKTAAFMAYKPTQSFHVVKYAPSGNIKSLEHIRNSGLLINTGYFIFRQDIFNYIQKGDDHFHESLQRMVNENKLLSWEHKGFWAGMDNFNDKQKLDESCARGYTPWEVWRYQDQNEHSLIKYQ